MENRTEFNLENALKQWTLNLKKSLQFTKSNLLELESHMLDEMERLQALGLTDEEAFVLAKYQMGTDNELISEFGKVNKKLNFVNRLAPYLKGMFLYIIFITFVQDMLMNFGLVLQYFNIEGDSARLLFSVFLIMVLSVLIGGVYRLYTHPETKLKKLASLRRLFIFAFLIIGTTNILKLFLHQINLDQYNLVYTYQDLILPHAIFVGGFHVLLIGVAIWFYRVKKKENTLQLSN